MAGGLEWNVAAVITIVGWLVSPIIGFLLPKILSRLGFEVDIQQKIDDLHSRILPELENRLHAVDQERMMPRGQKSNSVADALDRFATNLRHARDEVDDILDDGQHKILAGDILYGVAQTCIARLKSSYVGITPIVRSGSARVLQWSRNISLRLSEDVLPVITSAVARFNLSCMWIAPIARSRSTREENVHLLTTITIAPSHETVRVDNGDVSSDGPVPLVATDGALSHELATGSVASVVTVPVATDATSDGAVPVVAIDGAASHESAPTTTGAVASVGPAPVATYGASSSPATTGSVASVGTVPVSTDVSSDGAVPVVAIDGAASHESAPTTTGAVASVGPAPVATYGASSSPATTGSVASVRTVPVATDASSDGAVPVVAIDGAASHESAPTTTGVVASVGPAPVATYGASSSPAITGSVASVGTVSVSTDESSDGAVPVVAIDGIASHESAPTTTGVVASVGSAPVATYGASSSPATTGSVASVGTVPVSTDASSDGAVPVVAIDGAASHESAPTTTGAVASIGQAPVVTYGASSSPATTGGVASVGPALVSTDGAASQESAPTATDAAAPDESAPATIGGVASHGPVPLATNVAASDSCWWSSLDFFMNCCRAFFYWLVHAIEVARYYRDWSYREIVGIRSNQQENATVFDVVFSTFSRRKLRKRIEEVETIVCEVKKSPLLPEASSSASNSALDIANKYRSPIRSASNRKVFGREKLRDDIIAMLRAAPHGNAPSSSTRSCYSVIGIYGIAGSGKTTFARYIQDYIKRECKDKLFDIFMCIHVSENFSVDVIFQEMLNDLTKKNLNISDRVGLQKELKKAFCGKRFFLILDDLWVTNKNDPQLLELISPLKVGMNGSKILVTARRIDAVRAMGAAEAIRLPDLNEDQYLSMFMHYALDGTDIVDDVDHRPVGAQIAKKLHRSPIAAVAVAGRLAANPYIDFWKSTAKDDMLNDTRGALWWSYQLLNPDIRRCFEFCNIFPRRFELTREELVRLWIAEGFIKTSSSEKAMEDVAEDYIQELVSCAFLQPAVHKWSHYDFTIHDLLHDLLEKVAGSDYFRIENEGRQRGGNKVWKGDVPRDVRHLFVQNYNGELTTEKILGLENLRTLIFYDVGKDTLVEEKVIESICKMLPKLRVLAIGLRYCEVRPKEFSFPESISQLKHLRYLQFMADGTCAITLPSTLNKLHHIQLLDFHNCVILGFTSAGLVNLRHPIPSLEDIPNIGRLRSLQTLPYFRVRNEEGYELTQLRDLNELRRLDIEGLENVKSKVEALEANLAAKERLTELSLAWDNYYVTRCSPEVESEVLEDLCPHVGLEKLIISGYNGSEYPNWMVDKQNGGPENLQELMFDDCGQRGPGPELGAFPHLRKLELLNCSWVTLPANLEHLTSLKELTIYSCLNVEWLPTLPRSLEEFRVYSCYEGFSKSCQTVGHPNWQKIEHVPRKTIEQPIKEDVSGSTTLSPSPPH